MDRGGLPSGRSRAGNKPIKEDGEDRIGVLSKLWTWPAYTVCISTVMADCRNSCCSNSTGRRWPSANHRLYVAGGRCGVPRGAGKSRSYRPERTIGCPRARRHDSPRFLGSFSGSRAPGGLLGPRRPVRCRGRRTPGRARCQAPAAPDRSGRRPSNVQCRPERRQRRRRFPPGRRR